MAEMGNMGAAEVPVGAAGMAGRAVTPQPSRAPRTEDLVAAEAVAAMAAMEEMEVTEVGADMAEQ